MDNHEWWIKQFIKNGQKAYIVKNVDMVDELVENLIKGVFPDAV